MSIQEIIGRQELIDRSRLLDEILSTHNVILEFDRVTGRTKIWAWYPHFIFGVRLKT
jgi:hypothetical protein